MSDNGVDFGLTSIFNNAFFYRVKKGQYGISVSWYYRPEQVGGIFLFINVFDE